MPQTAVHSLRARDTQSAVPSTNQILRESYIYLHWNGILTHDKAEQEMATFAGAALIEPGERWKYLKVG